MGVSLWSSLSGMMPVRLGFVSMRGVGRSTCQTERRQ